jgi:carboxymethylenebutenolidase
MRKTGVLLLVLVFAVSLCAQDWAKARLAKSPRHGEWVMVKHGDRTVHSFVVYPEVRTKAAAVVVIHEIFGLTDWVQGVADQFAEHGYIAIAPDLLSGMGPNKGRTTDIPPDKVREAFASLPPDQITADLNAVADYVTKLPAASGKLAVAGFCWGGAQTFRFATNRANLGAALVFYGNGPDDAAAIGRIKAKVYGFYGENDARINATIPKSQELTKAAGVFYEPVTYPGAGHGFMRAGEAPPPPDDAKQQQKDNYEANRKAREEGWKRVLGILKGL